MSVNPEALALPEQQSPTAVIEVSRLQEVLLNTKRIVGRCALILGLAAGPMVGEAIISPTPAEATTFSNDYPDLDAQVYNLANYDWWKDEDGDSVYSGSGELTSSRGYAYRNCTDGASYWTNKYTGVNVAGWGNANSWDTSAPSSEVIAGNTNNIEPGDIAQSDGGTYGHVGFVTDVTKNSSGTVTSIKTAELNAAGTGLESEPTYSSKNANGYFTRTGTSYVWDHFIDVNGADKGLNNEPLSSPATNYPVRSVSAVLPNVMGGLSLFEAGDNGLLEYKDQTYPGEDLASKTWGTISEHVIGAPEIVPQSNGAFAVFAHGADGRLYHAWQTAAGSAWSGDISPWNLTLRGDPSVIFNYTGGMSVFVPDINGAMREIDQIGAGTDMSNRPVQNLGGNFQGKPAVMNIGGKQVVFARSASGTLQTNFQLNVGGAWSGWETIGGRGIVTDPKVIVNRLGGMTVMAVGAAGDIVGIDQVYQGESMNKPFYSLGKPAAGNLTGGLGLIQTPYGEQMVFATTASGTTYNRGQSSANGFAWSGYYALGGNVVTSLTTVRNNGNGVSLFGRQSNGDVVTLDQLSYGASFNANWVDLGK